MTDDQLFIRRDAARLAGDHWTAVDCDAAIDRNRRARIDRGVASLNKCSAAYSRGELTEAQHKRHMERVWAVLDRMGISSEVVTARFRKDQAAGEARRAWRW